MFSFYVRRQSLFSDSRYVIADLSKLWLYCSCPLAYWFPNVFWKYLEQSFYFESIWLSVIPETPCVHQIRYQCFHYPNTTNVDERWLKLVIIWKEIKRHQSRKCISIAVLRLTALSINTEEYILGYEICSLLKPLLWLLPKYNQCWWKVNLVGNHMERN